MYQQASPIEQAYSIYLAQQIFDNDCNDALTTIHISGRDAVPFLTQSGIDRSVLKTIWNVSDPQNVGNLTSINQLWLLLRLISLAQAGILQSQHSNSDMNALLTQYSMHKMSLPVFSTVMMPKPSHLMSMYGHLVVSATDSFLETNISTDTTTQSLGDVFGGLVKVEDAQLSGLKSDNSSNNHYSMPSTTQDPELSTTFQGPGNVQRNSQMMTSTLSSLSDVSSNYVGDGQQQQSLQQHQHLPAIPDATAATTTKPVSCNIPLPALNSQTQSISTKECDENDDNDDDDFCDFSSAIQDVPLPPQDDVTSSIDIMQAATTTSYTARTTETLKGQVSSSASNVSDDDNGEDNFGQFGSAISTNQQQQQQPFVTDFGENVSEPTFLPTGIEISNVSTVADSGQSLSLDPFGDLAPVENAPLPSLDVFARGIDESKHLPAPAPSTVTETSAPTLSADMSVQHDVFSPSLEITNETNIEDQNNDVDDDHDNEFSKFQMATTTTITAAKVATTALSGMTEIGRSLSITDAFGDMPTRDIPLPSLEMMKDTNTEDQKIDNEEKDKTKIESDAPLPISIPPQMDVTKSGRSLLITDVFDAFLVQQDAPLPSYEITKGTNTEEKYKDNEEEDECITQPDVVNPTSSPQMDATETGRSIPAQQDTPLSSLEMLNEANTENKIKENDTTEVGNDDDDDDDDDDEMFGTFEEAVESSVVPDSFSKSNVQQNEFTIMTRVGYSKSESSQVDPLAIKNMSCSLSITDAFGDMPIQDSPLPLLNIGGTTISIAESNGNHDHEIDYGAEETRESDLTETESSAIRSTFSATEDTTKDGIVFLSSNESIPQPEVITTSTSVKGEAENKEDKSASVAFESFVPTNGKIDDSGSEDAGPEAPLEDNGQSYNICAEAQDPCPDVGSDDESWGDFDEAPTTKPQLLVEVEDTGQYNNSLFNLDKAAPNLQSGQAQNSSSDTGSDKPIESCRDSNKAPVFEPKVPVEDATQGINNLSFFDKATPNLQSEQAQFFFSDTGSDELDESWGDFDEAPIIESKVPVEDTSEGDNNLFDLDQAPQNFQSEKAQNLSNESWGDFDEAPMIEPQTSVEYTREDNSLFDPDKTAPNLQSEKDSNPSSGAGNDKLDESWGDFDEAPIIEPLTPVVDIGEGDNDLFDLNKAAPDFQSEKEQNLSNKSWGDFDEAPTIDPQAPVESTREDDNLFDLDKAPPNLQLEEAPNPSSDAGNDKLDESWGDFDEAPTIWHLTSVVDTGEGDNNLFDLDKAAPNLQSEKAQIPSTDTGSDGNFVDREQFNIATSAESEQFKGTEEGIDTSNFENFGSIDGDNKFPEEVKNRDRIRFLALQLPACLLRKSGMSGEHVDLGEAYEVNIGINSTMDKSKKRREERCVEALESLTSTENSKLASTFWVQIFEVVNEELDNAKSLLDDTKSLSPGEWNEVQAPFSVMLRGLAECMRVTRSIVSSIGDVLLLDESAMLTVDTWASTWCSLSVLEKALDCEKTWKNINKQLTKTPLAAVTAASIEEIRSHSNDSYYCGDRGTFCHLTLQPLRDEDKGTTKAGTSFQGKQFMCASANFLVHRCPFFVVGEEI